MRKRGKFFVYHAFFYGYRKRRRINVKLVRFFVAVGNVDNAVAFGLVFKDKRYAVFYKYVRRTLQFFVVEHAAEAIHGVQQIPLLFFGQVAFVDAVITHKGKITKPLHNFLFGHNYSVN